MCNEEAHLRTRCARIAIAAVAAVLIWQALNVRFNYAGNWTGLFFTGGLQNVPPDLAPATYKHPNSYGYDGQFYRYIARDPSPAGRYAAYVDDPKLRYQRILLPAMAHLSGSPDAALIVLVLLSTGAGVYWTARYLARSGVRPEWGAVFLLIPATIASFDRMLLDGALLACFAGFLLYVEEERWRVLLLLCVMAPLVRETGLILPAAVAAQMLVQRRWVMAALFAAATLPAIAWWAYVATVTPATAALPVFSWPVAGIVARLFSPRHIDDALTQSILRVTDCLALSGLLASFILGIRELTAVRTVAARVAAAGFIVLGAVLTGAPYLIEPFGFSRPISPLLLMLALAALQGRSLWNLFPPLAMTAGVGIYDLAPAVGIVKGLIALART